MWNIKHIITSWFQVTRQTITSSASWMYTLSFLSFASERYIQLASEVIVCPSPSPTVIICLLSIYLPVCLYNYLHDISIYLSIKYISIWLNMSLSLSFSLTLSIYLSICMSIWLSTYIVYVSVYLSHSLSNIIYLSV